MPNINDCMYESLVAQGHTPGTIQDMMMKYLIANIGGPSQGHTINDFWHQLWDEAAVPSGAYADRAYSWLDDLNYQQGHLSDKWAAFWCDGGILATSDNLLLNSKLCDEDDSGDPDSWWHDILIDIMLFRRLSGLSSWYLTATGDETTILAQVVNLAIGDYTASFRIDEKVGPTTDYKVGQITGANVSITVDFPNLSAVSVPGWAHCTFSVTLQSDVTFTMQAITPDAVNESIVVSRPQLIEEDAFMHSELTGDDCTGADIELLFDSEGSPLQDSEGEYLYVPI